MWLENIEDFGTVIERGDAGLLGAVAEGHGTEDDTHGGLGEVGAIIVVVLSFR